MTIQEDFEINKIVQESANTGVRTNYNSDLNFKLFLNPNLLPLVPKSEMLVGLSENSFVLREVAEQYKKFTDLITRKILQNKVNFEFYNFTEKPKFYNNNLFEAFTNNLNTYYNLYISYLNGRKIKITNITDFYDHFLIYINKYSNILPLTFYNLNFNKRLFFENTGLTILLKQKKIGDPINYFQDFLTFSKKRNFNDYIKIANLQGFEVDLANPYRMVYNPYRKINNTNIKKFYSDNFINYFDFEISFLDTFIATMYNEYNNNRFANHIIEKDKVYFSNEMCFNYIKTIKENITRGGQLTTEQKLKLYLYALLSEKNNLNTPNKEKILHNAIQTAEVLDMPTAMQYILAQTKRIGKTTTITRTI